ncbi:MAG TPA: ABC transporter permease [Leptolyngbyaceae cyanobacterium M33_DOE_097]|uniref:ABC transporter permease n=1 Tax=Oscillatoriales cyanobacterium SpSt-418 TaxID=2282169 RepID=A0A7C3KDG4_9CYAN|nr:ABC transporter permease [Leptolyngbyaceae cyanobacterium M33_DOE_097]
MQPTSVKDIQASTPPLLTVSTGRKWLRRLTPSLWFLVGWAILALGWELGAATQVLNPDILPPPSQVIPYLLTGELSAGIGPQQVSYGEAIVRTLVRVFAGLVLGILAALPLGTLIASVPIFRQFALPIMQTIAPIAPVAWVPVAIALVGTGDQSAIFVVFMGIFAVMTLATAAAISSVPEELLKTARSLGISGIRLYLWVVFPAVSPSLLTIIRVNFFAAWMAVLAGEMAGINSGLGALIILGQQQFNMKLVMAGIITIGVIGFAIDRLMLFIQRRLLWWEQGRLIGGNRG